MHQRPDRPRSGAVPAVLEVVYAVVREALRMAYSQALSPTIFNATGFPRSRPASTATISGPASPWT